MTKKDVLSNENLIKLLTEQAHNNSQLKMSMDRLSDRLDDLYALFEATNKDIMSDYAGSEQEHHVMLKKILNQNEKIAKGLLALHELIDDNSTLTTSYPLSSKHKSS